MAKNRSTHHSNRRNRQSDSDLRLRDGLEIPVGDTTMTIRVDQQRATIFLGDYESSGINLLDPGDLDFEYMQQMTCALDAFIPRPRKVHALHLGGCACALPWAWETHRPGSSQVAVEINSDIAQACRALFDLPRSPRLRIRVDDAHRVISSAKARNYDVIVRDVFNGPHTPRRLRSAQFYRRAHAALADDGILLVNCGHGRGFDARGDVAAALAEFAHVAMVAEGKTLAGGRRGNLVLIAVGAGHPHINRGWAECQRRLRSLPLSVRFLPRADVERWVGTTQPIHDE
ncbi:MAG: fused MFS/spermidine synthase [Actinomycetaceae bacterium]|nr:fused MFS/spermidine synthase [Actinomycetaceae bacterium]